MNVSSSLHKAGSVGDLLADPMWSASGVYSMFAAYERSKLAQVVLTVEDQRREDARVAQGGAGGGPGAAAAAGSDAITFVAVHPGNAQTEVSRSFPPPVHQAYVLLQPLLRCAQAGVADAATTSVFAVASADAAALRGAYLERSAVVPMNPEAAEGAAGRQLGEMVDEMLRRHL